MTLMQLNKPPGVAYPLFRDNVCLIIFSSCGLSLLIRLCSRIRVNMILGSYMLLLPVAQAILGLHH